MLTHKWAPAASTTLAAAVPGALGPSWGLWWINGGDGGGVCVGMVTTKGMVGGLLWLALPTIMSVAVELLVVVRGDGDDVIAVVAMEGMGIGMGID